MSSVDLKRLVFISSDYENYELLERCAFSRRLVVKINSCRERSSGTSRLLKAFVPAARGSTDVLCFSESQMNHLGWNSAARLSRSAETSSRGYAMFDLLSSGALLGQKLVA